MVKGLSRLKLIVKKVIATQRFNWNSDLLRSSTEFEEEDGQSDAAASADVKVLSDEELDQRCSVLENSITMVMFNYLRRGLFESDKLMVASMLCLRVLVKAGTLTETEVQLLTNPSLSPDTNMGPLVEWMQETTWQKLKALESIPKLENLGMTLQGDNEEWRAWFNLERPEMAPLPSEDFEDISDFHRMLILRAMRPDRVTTALASFVGKQLGAEFVEQKPFDMDGTYQESSASTPIFFVLFPGVDPTRQVESLGQKFGITTDNGRFVNISMGQGQEGPAEEVLMRFAADGGWIMLQNLHLMQAWLPRLEQLLEKCADTAHPDFRCFISAEPPPFSHQKNIPESLMQSCIKVSNEAPAGLKSNLSRAWSNFGQDSVDACTKPNEYKACLFTVCLYHSLIVGRRRFGQQGWSRGYSFNTGDLTVCGNVLMEYLNANAEVPWDDLKYIFGEIMYGGHITDPWDRRTNNTYLKVLLQPGIFEGGNLVPGFPSPNPATTNHAGYLSYIDAKLPVETPQLFGMHPNAEIGYLNDQQERVFSTIVSIEAGGSSGGGASTSSVNTKIEELLAELPENFDMITINDMAEERYKEKPETAPYVVVAVQECARMNVLMSEIRRSLVELSMGLDGQLNMSGAMEDLREALGIGQVPGRNPFHRMSWEKLAWPSNKSLVTWFADMRLRVSQLTSWSSSLELPMSMWMPGLFNPPAFLTAIQQVTARRTGLPLDRMTTTTYVSKYMRQEEVSEYPEDGAYIHGLFLEGARWVTGADGDFDDDNFVEVDEEVVVGNTPCVGQLADSRLKELLAPMPLVYVRAVEVKPNWVASSVGYLRNEPGVYECPVYTTTFRGPTYIFLTTLTSKDPVEKWILAGVAIVTQTDD